MYDPGDKAGAIDAFLTAVVGANYRQIIEQFLPPGALELAVTDLDTFSRSNSRPCSSGV
jgi:hypothetical protein